MSTEKTLADVQPGGRVRLGDGPTIVKQARELLAKEWETLSFDAPVEELREGCELPPVVAAGVRAIVAALSAHPFPDGQRDNSDLLAGLRDVEEHLYCAGSNPSHTETVRAAINAVSAQPSPGGQDAPVTDEMVDAACRAYYDTAEDVVAVDHTCMEAALKAALAVRQPVGEPVCRGGFVIANGSGEKYMAWGQVGPEWTADRSAALWLVRRADAEALAAENEDAWSILPVERCAMPPSGWACTLAGGHEGPCPTIAAAPAQAVDLGQFREAVLAQFELARSEETMPRPGRLKMEAAIAERDRLLALIDSQAVGK